MDTVHAQGTATIGEFATGEAINLTVRTYNGNQLVYLSYTDHKGFDHNWGHEDGYVTVQNKSVAAAAHDNSGSKAVVHVDLPTKTFQLDVDGVTKAKGVADLFWFQVGDTSKFGTVPAAIST